MQPTVLLVDGDPVILATLAKGLHEHGFKTITATDLESALTLLNSSKPDMAIVDYDMPRMAAATLARHITATSNMPFMFLSALTDESYYEGALNLGAIGYLVKPLDPIHIALSIWAGLQNSSTIHRLRDQSSDLSIALNADREVSVVTGFLMERLGVTQEQAFEALRQCSRNRRRAIKGLSREILDTAAELSSILAEIQDLIAAQKVRSAS